MIADRIISQNCKVLRSKVDEVMSKIDEKLGRCKRCVVTEEQLSEVVSMIEDEGIAPSLLIKVRQNRKGQMEVKKRI